MITPRHMIPLLLAVVVSVGLCGVARADYASEVLSDNPLGYWRFEDASSANGTTAANSSTSGSTHDGIYNGNVTQIVGGHINLGTAISLDGDNDFVDVANGDAFRAPGGTNFSVETWIKVAPDASGTYERIVDQGFGFGAGWTLAMTGNTGQVGLYRNGSANAESSVAVDDNAWHHVVGTYDGTNTKVYVDGGLWANVAAAATLGAGAANLRIGINQGGTEDYVGGLDEVAVYGVALGIDRIAAHAAAGGIDAPLINNGSFETPVVGSGLLDVNPGDTTGGWTQDAGGVKGHYLSSDWQPQDGSQSYHLGAGHAAGSVSQTFPTTAGQPYELTFWSSGYPTADDPQWGTVSVGDLSNEVYWTPRGASTADMGWTEQTFTFTATGATSTLVFGSPSGTQGTIGIDNVQVTLIPEPSSLLLSALGLIGILVSGWRRPIGR